MPTVILKKGKEKSLQRRHPWIFSGAIQTIPKDLAEGEIAYVADAEGNILATAYYSTGSIALRVLEFDRIKNPTTWLQQKIRAAYQRRTSANLTNNPQTNCYRLFFAEGDGLPGLIIDIYNTTAVLQCHSIGIYNLRAPIVEVLKELPGIQAVYNKSAESLKNKEIENGYLFGGPQEAVVLENGLQFEVDWVAGQKTGFFLDQRENRLRLQHLANGAKVLNLFCYTGGFSVYALAGGAKEVVSVDISAAAVAQAAANAARNGFEAHHTAVVADCFEYLKNMADDFDMVILDPPAFAKNLRATHNALVAYKRLNAMAMKKMKPGSKLLTFSCSQHITAPLFADAVRAAAIEVGKGVQVIGHFTQPEDHPNNIFHPEGQYLKGLLLQLV